MYDAFITYVDKQDRELLELVNTDLPVYLHFFDMKTSEGKKGGLKIKRKYAAKLDPFIVVSEGDKDKVFYSEQGTNAIRQLIMWLNGKE